MHYRMLKFKVRHGIIIEKVHNIISFKHSLWLKRYTDFHTQKRNKAETDFEKYFHNFS